MLGIDNQIFKVDINSLRTQSTTIKGKTSNIPEVDRHFTGRKDVLGKIVANFKDNNRFAITGPGGFGKTQIALKYAHDNRNMYKHIWLVNAHDELSLEKSYREFGDLIGVSKDLKSERLINYVNHWLASNRKCLFIYDNAEGLGKAKLHKFLPQGHIKGHIIICTREIRFDKDIAEFEIDVFTPDEATAFLTSHSVAYDNALALSERLGYLPLALNLVVLYLRENPSVSCTKYIELLGKHGLSMLDKPLTEEEKNEFQKKAVASTWKLSMDKITEEARQLLHLFAYCAPDNIPLAMFIDGNTQLPSPLNKALDPENEIEHIDLIRELSKYGLASHSSTNSDDNFLSIHRLIQEAIQLQHKGDNGWLRFCFNMTRNVFKYDYGSAPLRTKFKHNVSHVMQIAEYSEKEFEGDSGIQEGVGWLYNMAGLGLHYEIKYPEALKWHNKSLGIREKILDKEHPDIAQTNNNIAMVYCNQGKYSEALKLYNKSLVIREKILGKEHPDTATTYNNIAFVYHNQGKYPEALNLYLQSYKICLNKLGAGHPHTNNVKNNMRLAYNETKPKQAFDEWLTQNISQKADEMELPNTPKYQIEVRK